VSALDELKAGIVKTGSSFELAMLSPLLVSASPRLLGGVKSQLSLQIVLSKLGVHVIPNSFALGAAHPCFDAEGGLKDADVEKAVRGVGAVLAEMVARTGASGRGGLAA
jgi:NAD(P)H-dependent FMN reductase